MELRDLIVTPIVLFIVYVLAYLIRSRVTDVNTRRYFIPALTVKIIGALAVGFIYQFYYGGGDTFAFHTHGSRIIWEAFFDDPSKGLKLFFANGEFSGDVFKYSSKIWYFKDPYSYLVIRIAFLLDLLTVSCYSATAVLFAVLSFSGIWALYLTFYSTFKSLHFWLAFGILFVPSVFFWGSGILKDTLTLGSLGWMTYSFQQVVIKQKVALQFVFIFFLAAFLIFFIKKYILLSFLPALLIWLTASYFHKIKNIVFKLLITPLIILVCIGLGYITIQQVGRDDPRYALSNLAKTAQVTAYDIRYGWGARFGDGSGYSLGELDGSFGNMFRLAPQAINVSLFRPYLWEVKNPLMLLSALEALSCFVLTLWVMFKISPKRFLFNLFKPEVLFCLVFSMVFAFAVGISTYNFGTLARYKIPLLPFYFTAMILLYHYGKLKKTVNEFI
ncbi:hypothetical protein FNH22_18495 [Fulvivirga sp. M361]|uniref:hypothetical protein n=1 Tax=Fulvivirga sp. M361 TaxID=2594266 RepID=UPI00117A2DCD|nr:hypothetical protein [Fulvivirga sp. M361]TRX55616.1 hypothetical protein FNH22_18495 [Fulvivirga sp. M361]